MKLGPGFGAGGKHVDTLSSAVHAFCRREACMLIKHAQSASFRLTQ